MRLAVNKIGKLLKESRTDAGLSASALIEKSNLGSLTRASISLYEHGRITPGKERLIAMLEACGVETPKWVDDYYRRIVSQSPNMAQTAPGLRRQKQREMAASRLRDKRITQISRLTARLERLAEKSRQTKALIKKLTALVS
jgi:transcriptional regulator with XRE-family HTH domain